MSARFERKCNKCDKVKPVSEFYKDRPNGSKRYECKDCHLEYYRNRWKDADPSYRDARKESSRKYILSQYGLTQEDYDTMLKGQGFVCAVCGTEPESGNLAIDHCHKSGGVRGLLCKQCNAAIGLLGDDVEGLRRALSYLENYYEGDSS